MEQDRTLFQASTPFGAVDFNDLRLLAVHVLVRVFSHQESLDEVMHETFELLQQSSKISQENKPRSKAWLQEICSGTLRWKGRLDSLIDSIAVKKKPSGWLRKILLLSSYQIIAQDRICISSVVSETVSCVQLKLGKPSAQFTNACLRKVALHNEDSLRELMPMSAAWASMSEWLWGQIIKQFGIEWASAYAQASLERPTLWVRLRPTALAIQSRVESSETPAFPGGTLVGPVPGSWMISNPKNPIPTLSSWIHHEFQQGKLFVQDISNQWLIHEISHEIQKAFPGQPLEMLDLCAAPGGKSAGMAWNGFQVSSTDFIDTRLPLLRQTIAATAPESITLVPWANVFPTKKEHPSQISTSLCWESFHLIWLDAPCSGSGLLKRHPEIRWCRTEKDLFNLVQIQTDLLLRTWEKMRIGQFLVYSVCSILQEEGPQVITTVGLTQFLKKSWFLCPQVSPGGDGFWAGLFKKE